MKQMLRSLDVLILDHSFDKKYISHSQLIRFNGKTRLGNDVVGKNINETHKMSTQQRKAAKTHTQKCQKDKG